MKYIYYINVGDLPKDKALAFVKDTMENSGLKLAMNLGADDSLVYIPVRKNDGYTRIEALP